MLGSSASAQTRPPVLTSVAPYGIQRGTTVTVAVEGANIAQTDRVIFADSGLSAEIGAFESLGPDIRKRMPNETGAIIQDKAEKGRLTLHITASSTAELGRQLFRLHTPLGSSSTVAFWVGDDREVTEVEPNDDARSAMALEGPRTVNGVLEKEGDADCYRIVARAGHDLVVSVVAAPIGSTADVAATVLALDGAELASNDDNRGNRDPLIVYRPEHDGEVVVRVTDVNAGGSPRHVYRVTIGDVPVITSVFPLGRAPQNRVPLAVEGANLAGHAKATTGAPRPERPKLVPVVVPGLAREPVNRTEVALGRYPETLEREGNDTLATAQPIPWPVTVNGRINARGHADTDLFRVTATKGQRLVIQVAAARLGSSLDSVIEVLDAKGATVPRARLRPVWETTVDLRNHGSTGTGIRLLAWNELGRGDYVYIDRELLRVQELPKGPDEDTFFAGFRGQRISYLDTTAEAHALLRPVYKVDVLAPGTPVSPNGLPVFDVAYRNDDGGPLYGKDSHLEFTAPRDGTYYVRLTDARGTGGPQHGYRLTVAPPDPDFDLFVTPANPNVPRGGRVPVTIFAWRRDGFNAPIAVTLTGAPAGVTATPAVILPDESSVVLTLEAADNASADIVPLQVTGRARLGARSIERAAIPDERVSVVSVAAPPDVRVVSVTPDVIELAPGGRAKVTAKIARANGFTGRVPLSVNNLPFRVTVPDIGLNGILITEDQDTRSFEIVADENVRPVEQTLFVTARVETNGGTNSEHSSQPIRIRISARDTRASR
jgi:hypothetical protein